MTTTEKSKTRPQLLFTAQGTVLGTSPIIDTSGWQYMQLMSIHGGTSGSRTVTVAINAGTTMGTTNTALPNPLVVGTANSDQAGAGSVVWHCGSLTDQAVVGLGTGLAPAFSLSYMLYE